MFAAPQKVGGTVQVRRLRAVVALAAACLVTTGIVAFAIPDTSDRCSLSSTLVPTCGAIWGVVTDPHTEQQLLRVERAVHTRFQMVYRFHDLDDIVPTPDERRLVKHGRLLHIDIHTKLHKTSRIVSWPEVTDGAFDSTLANQARGIASLKAPVYVTFEHEPERPDRANRGSHADFIAAWRHVYNLFERNGAHNAVWVWVVTGYPPFSRAAAASWPGNDYVDWISWEAYNTSGCAQSAVTPKKYTSFRNAVLPFYHWIHKHGAQYDINTNKPIMISEAGSVVYRDRPELTADWYLGIPQVLSEYSQIKAVTLWDRPGNGACDYRFNAFPTVRAAIAEAGFEVQYPSLDLLAKANSDRRQSG